jgi:hypothetical protein
VGEIPKSLIIGGHETPIRVGENDIALLTANSRGRFNTDELVIDIYGPMGHSWQLQTLCHEIIHGFCNAANLNDLPEGVEEKICHGLENSFFLFLANNDLSFFRNLPEPAPAQP